MGKGCLGVGPGAGEALEPEERGPLVSDLKVPRHPLVCIPASKF